MRTIWLASYPKSGNTWLRMLIANLSATDGRPVDINALPEGGEIASAREPFEYLLLIDSTLLTHEEVDRLRPRVYEALARGEGQEDQGPHGLPEIRFVKAHDAYTLTPDGEPLLAGARGADGAIVIVRDPRDIAPSLAHHMNVDLDTAIVFMNNVHSRFCGSSDRAFHQLRQRLLGWSGHVASWLDQSDIPVHLVRYEDMTADTAGVLRDALAFAGRPATEEEIGRAVSLASFEELSRQEREKGFREAPNPHPRGRFFRRGQAGAWRDELTAEQVSRIESAHAPMMHRLGYALAGDLEPMPVRGE